MRPSTRELIEDVARRYQVEPGEILSRKKPRLLLAARIEIAKELEARGYYVSQIASVLGRNHTTASFYLGKLTSKQPRPKPPKAMKPRQPLRYAGFDPTEARSLWEEETR